jgi:L-threonylcarbamoyladenylate synthase
MTKFLTADPAGIARAAELICRGDLVAFGTETVYGLGGDGTNAHAIARIFAAKGRPRFNPLICHYPAAEAALGAVEGNALAERLAARFWPGPLTLVLRRRADCGVAPLAAAGLDTLAVRVPVQVTARALLAAVGRPVAAPSANRSGRVSPTTAADVVEELGDSVAAVLDTGPCPVGIESTVLDLTGPPCLLRPGGITLEAIVREAGLVAVAGEPDEAGEARRSPGLLRSHYAPSLPIRLEADLVGADEALLAFGEPLSGAGIVFNLSPAGNLEEAAARLFAGLRWLDQEGQRRGLCRIAAMAVPAFGLGLAITDRLRRAAAPRANF